MARPAPRCPHCDRPVLPKQAQVQYHRSGRTAHLKCVSVASLAAEDAITPSKEV